MHKPREVRIGLVLYGGVSLAVYINGVAQELFRAVRGHGIYRLLKALLGADIVVDVISGTSAGGINGIYLAYSMCQPERAKNFLDFSGLWRNDGDIAKLLRHVGSPAPDSLLDGEGYYQERLKAAFTNLGDWPAGDEDPSDLQELDLFITGTDFHGCVYTRFDDTGQAIPVKDHRAVFKLKFRRGRSNDFGPLNSGDKTVSPETRHDQLAKLARITSCFPVAFPPVRVSKEDDLIRRWGYLNKNPLLPDTGEEPPRYYLDGGVLDNKPFSYTTDAIFHRTAEKPVTRKLFYVEPAPEHFDSRNLPASPNVLQAGVGALTVIPGYESIAGDLRAIGERNTRIQRFQELARNLTRPSDTRTGRVPTIEQWNLHRVSRLNVLLDRVLAGILRQDGHETWLNPAQQRVASDLYKKFFEKFQGGEQDQVLDCFDAHARMRRLFHVTYALDSGSPLAGPDLEAVRTCNQWIHCVEVILFAMESLVDQLHVTWYDMGTSGELSLRPLDDIWRDVDAALRSLLAADEGVTQFLQAPPDEPALEKLHTELKRRVNVLAPGGPIPPTGTPTLLQFLDQQFQKPDFLGGSPAARQAWADFPWIDVHLYPLQAAAGVFELDEIRTVRISPNDAQLGFSRRAAADKLAGDQFAHFGGFFKRSWRSNDLLWGRLDGLCRIFEALLTEEAVETGATDAAGAADRLGVIASLNPPGELAEWLRDLADPNRPDHKKALGALAGDERGKPGGLLDRLVRFAQADLVRDGLESVVEDSIQEQIEWNRCRTGDPGQVSFHVDGLRFTRPNSGFISLAAEELAKRALEEVKDPTRFFEDPERYTVGSETIADDVPKPVLVELATRAVLVLRDCLVPQIERTRLQITKWRAYRYGVDWPARLIHAFAQLARFAPTTARVIAWVLCVYSLAALCVGVKWWPTFVRPAGSDINLSAFLVLFAGPVVYLLALPELLDWLYPRVKSAWRTWAPVTFLAALAAASALGLARLRGALAGFLRSRADVLSDAVLVGVTVLLSAVLLWRVCRWLLGRLHLGWKGNTSRIASLLRSRS